MKKIVFVTQNKNKVIDLQKILPNFQVENIDFEIDEIQSMSPEKVIEHKLKQAYEKMQIPCFVQDTSLFIESLNGFPGPFIKFFYETIGAETICKILENQENRKAIWKSIIGIYDGENITYLEEKVEGEIAKKPKGENGYSWDSIFIPTGEGKTLAEMTFEEKHKYTPTIKLLERLKGFLEKM